MKKFKNVFLIALFLIGVTTITTMVVAQSAAPAAPAAIAPAAAPAVGAPVVAPPSSPEQALGLLSALIAAFKSGNWALVSAIGIMLAVYLLRLFVLPKLKVSSDKLPYISAGLGLLVAIAVNLSAGQPWMVAIFSGISMGAAASGFWHLIGEKIFPKPAAPAPAAPQA